MKKFIVLMSHDMSELQKKDAYESLKINDIVEAPNNIKKIWSNINPIGELDLSKLDIVISWIDSISQDGDYVLVQGEFGATFYIVDYCFKSNLIPVYATTKRQVEEIIEDDRVLTNRIFIHQGYRNYIRYQK